MEKLNYAYSEYVDLINEGYDKSDALNEITSRYQVSKSTILKMYKEEFGD